MTDDAPGESAPAQQQPPQPAAPPPPPPPSEAHHRFPALIWLVPLLAAVIGIAMLAHSWLSVGPQIHITFQSASGLEAGKTPVKYKDVTVGTVKAVTLGPDDKRVIVTVSLNKSAESLARKDTSFWVVRPRISLAGVSGIGTLLSGSFIAVDKGTSNQFTTEFTGLETPPAVLHGTPGRSFVLHAKDLGSLEIGSPIYFRHIRVGRIAAYKLAKDGKNVIFTVFVRAPYDQFVTERSRFWNASGIDVSLGTGGLKLKTQSLATVLSGGVAFANLPQPTSQNPNAADAQIPATPAKADAVFDLFSSESEAMTPPEGNSIHIEMRFNHPERGLKPGADVDFEGFSVGKVTSVKLDYNPEKDSFPLVVGANLYPDRLGQVFYTLQRLKGDSPKDVARFTAQLVKNGLRAQVKSANILTGELYVALDFVPKAKPVTFDMNAVPIELPTIDGGLSQAQQQVMAIIAKVNRIPLDQIGDNLNQSLAGLDKAIKKINAELLPGADKTLDRTQTAMYSVQQLIGQNSNLMQELRQALTQITRTARSIKTLTDLLGSDPSALLRGLPRSR